LIHERLNWLLNSKCEGKVNENTPWYDEGLWGYLPVLGDVIDIVDLTSATERLKSNYSDYLAGDSGLSITHIQSDQLQVGVQTALVGFTFLGVSAKAARTAWRELRQISSVPNSAKSAFLPGLQIHSTASLDFHLKNSSPGAKKAAERLSHTLSRLERLDLAKVSKKELQDTSETLARQIKEHLSLQGIPSKIVIGSDGRNLVEVSPNRRSSGGVPYLTRLANALNDPKSNALSKIKDAKKRGLNLKVVFDPVDLKEAKGGALFYPDSGKIVLPNESLSNPFRSNSLIVHETKHGLVETGRRVGENNWNVNIRRELENGHFNELYKSFALDETIAYSKQNQKMLYELNKELGSKTFDRERATAIAQNIESASTRQLELSKTGAKSLLQVSNGDLVEVIGLRNPSDSTMGGQPSRTYRGQVGGKKVIVRTSISSMDKLNEVTMVNTKLSREGAYYNKYAEKIKKIITQSDSERDLRSIQKYSQAFTYLIDLKRYPHRIANLNSEMIRAISNPTKNSQNQVMEFLLDDHVTAHVMGNKTRFVHNLNGKAIEFDSNGFHVLSWD
ncbi:MAG: hypothetical protein KDD25_06040, partial [Bdellovibrionales bacterium]|nr:hypothetical protein [Bdellovibrionales bacterium]